MNKSKNTIPIRAISRQIIWNHYCLREYTVKAREILPVKSRHAALHKESEAVMKIVVMTSPKLIAPILRRIFGVRKKI